MSGICVSVKVIELASVFTIIIGVWICLTVSYISVFLWGVGSVWQCGIFLFFFWGEGLDLFDSVVFIFLAIIIGVWICLTVWYIFVFLFEGLDLFDSLVYFCFSFGGVGVWIYLTVWYNFVFLLGEWGVGSVWQCGIFFCFPFYCCCFVYPYCWYFCTLSLNFYLTSHLFPWKQIG